MPELSLVNLALVAAVAFLGPILLNLSPARRLPNVVFEIVAGIMVGPAVLGWVRPDEAVRVMAVVGLGFLLFLAGLEIEIQKLRGPVLRTALLAFAASIAIGVIAGQALGLAGLAETPLLVTVILLATSLGVVVPVLKDSGRAGSDFGQLVIASCSIADFGAIVLVSLLFSRSASGPAVQIGLIGALIAVVLALTLAVREIEHLRVVREVLTRLQDTTAQIRVRGAFLLLTALIAVAERLGLEVILGAFFAGAILTLIDKDEQMTHPLFRTKLDAVGYGVFIPIFFVASGLQFNLSALLANPAALASVPIFLLALVLVRGLPTILYRRTVRSNELIAAALLQGTSLPFIVATTMIGRELGLIGEATSASLITAGLLSVILFPLGALAALGSQGEGRRAQGEEALKVEG